MVFKQISEIPQEYRVHDTMNLVSYLKGGKLQTWDGATQEVLSPIRLKQEDGSFQKVVLGTVPLMKKELALELLEETSQAYDKGRGVWPQMKISERISVLEKFTKNLQEYRRECINVLMWEIAKNLNDATAEFDRTIKYIYDSIEALKELERREEDFKVVSGIIAKQKRSPLGTTLVMGPYNYPLNETFATIIPALIMGNTVIVKPPKRGSLIYEFVVKAAEGVFPKGVFSAVYGRGAEIISPMMQTGTIDVFAFIGAHSTANKIALAHPKPNRLKLVYGLDAKNVGIITRTAQIATAVSESLVGTTSYNGQRCTALKLLYVHESVYDDFLAQYLEGLKGFSYGLPFDNTKITPVPDERVSYFKELTKDALEKGAKLEFSLGEDVESYVAPKVFSGVTKDMRLFQEEQFGPLIPIMKYSSTDEVLDTIVESQYGQQCSLFGTDAKELGELVDILTHQVSRVNINAQAQRGPDVLPFTGRKDSAVGVLSVVDALNTFSIETLVTCKSNSENKKLLQSIEEKKASVFLNKELLL